MGARFVLVEAVQSQWLCINAYSVHHACGLRAMALRAKSPCSMVCGEWPGCIHTYLYDVIIYLAMLMLGLFWRVETGACRNLWG